MTRCSGEPRHRHIIFINKNTVLKDCDEDKSQNQRTSNQANKSKKEPEASGGEPGSRTEAEPENSGGRSWERSGFPHEAGAKVEADLECE